MIPALITLAYIATYGIIGTLYGAWVFPQLDPAQRPYPKGYNDGKIGCYPWDAYETARFQGVFWPVFLTWTLVKIPGKYIAGFGLKLGEMSLKRQRDVIDKRIRIAEEQEKIRVELQRLEEESVHEVEDCLTRQGRGV